MASTSMVHRRCPVCAEDQPQPHWSKPPLLVVRCGRCSMLYADPVPQSLVSGEFYGGSAYHVSPEKLEGDFAPVRFEREVKLLRRFCPSGSVLDVGCSTGAFLHRLKTAFGGAYQLLGTDVPGPALDYARSQGLRVIERSFLEHDFGQEPFDAITFWAVLEHLDQPRPFLRRAADLLRPGGHCFILVPNMRSLAVRLLGKRYRYILPEHLNYFTCETLIRFAETEPLFALRRTGTTHFNPVVIWQDWRRGGTLVPEDDRAQLLKRTTALKQNRFLAPLRLLYKMTEKLLAAADLADNLVLVLQRR